MPDTPHLGLPFRVVQGRPVTVEQGSTDDIAAQARAVLLTRPGERDALPEFGSPDLTFSQLPVDPDVLAAAVERWVPAAAVTAESDPDAVRDAVLAVRMNLQTSAEEA